MSTLGSRTTQGNRRGLGETLLFDEKLERPIAPPTGRNLEHAGLGALGIENRSDIEALQERAPGDVLRQLLDRDTGLHAPDIRLGQNKLVEGDVSSTQHDGRAQQHGGRALDRLAFAVVRASGIHRSNSATGGQPDSPPVGEPVRSV
jgi:hypothetical protein